MGLEIRCTRCLTSSNPANVGLQEQFAMQVVQTAGGKPVILILVNGGALGIENLVAVDGESPTSFCA